MKHEMVFSLVAVGILFYTTFSWGHSAMFPDSFKYDASNENENPIPFARLEESLATNSCVNGLANGYPCENIDFRSFVSKTALGGGASELSDIWGYTDPLTGKEIAIVGKTNGTSFVDITDPDNPVVLGFLRSHNNGSESWRDMKVYGDFVFIVGDGPSNSTHGLQVFDLTELRDVFNPPANFTETTHMRGFGAAHNIIINEDTGFAYAVGSNRCSGGLYMVDISIPDQPSFAGCFSSDGYTHDAQCVVYAGPDDRYDGKEICVGYNEDTITIVDVTDKANPLQLSRTPYQGSQYTHQGWFLDEKHSILIMNDELDEQRNGVNTTSYIFDVSNLQNPVELGRYRGPTRAIDHNLYTNEGYVFETNYRAGLRILKTDNIDQGQLSEVAYFDTIPGSNSAQFSGTWSNYPYFASGNIVLSDIGKGLFVVTPDWDAITGPFQPVVTITALQAEATEAGQRAGILRVRRDGSTAAALSVNYTLSGSATSGSDYLALSGSLTLPAGVASADITLTPIDDTLVEAPEIVIVSLAGNAGYTVGLPGTATVTIVSDDSVEPQGADLQVSVLSGDISVAPGSGLSYSVTAHNAGDQQAGGNYLRLVLSTDAVIDANDLRLSKPSLSVAKLAAGSNKAFTGTVIIPATVTSGDYYLGAIVDVSARVIESDETNNTRSMAVRVQSTAPSGADLVVSGLTPNKLTLAPGDSLRATVITTNQGAGASSVTYTRLVLSTDPVIDRSDRKLRALRIDGLIPGASRTNRPRLTIPADVPVGTYYLGAFADNSGREAESDETNNTRSVTVAIASTSAPRQNIDNNSVVRNAEDQVHYP